MSTNKMRVLTLISVIVSCVLFIFKGEHNMVWVLSPIIGTATLWFVCCIGIGITSRFDDDIANRIKKL